MEDGWHPMDISVPESGSGPGDPVASGGGDGRTIEVRFEGPGGGVLDPIEGEWYQPAVAQAGGAD